LDLDAQLGKKEVDLDIIQLATQFVNNTKANSSKLALKSQYRV
jgi:hypothetical protein